MVERDPRKLLLLTDDNFLAEVMGTYLRADGISVQRITPEDEVAAGADGILVDLSKRDVHGELIIALSFRAQRAKIPLLLMSAQPRRDVAQFAAVVRANDVVSKTEKMGTIAARLRMWMNAPSADVENADGFLIPDLEVASV